MTCSSYIRVVWGGFRVFWGGLGCFNGPQQKYRLGMISIKILRGLNLIYRIPTPPSASVMAQNIQLFGPCEGVDHRGSLPMNSVVRLTDGSPYVPRVPVYLKTHISVTIIYSVVIFLFFGPKGVCGSTQALYLCMITPIFGPQKIHITIWSYMFYDKNVHEQLTICFEP